MNPWITLLESLDLTKTEKSVLERFRGDPVGRAFLPVADILRSHNRVEESLELLANGLDTHPNFSVARVVLSRELFQRGMVANAWQVLLDSPSSLGDNVLAQKLRFKLSILLSRVSDFKVTRDHMQSYRMLDDECQKLSDLVAVSGISRAKDQLIQDLRSKGIEPVLPETGELLSSQDDGSATLEEEQKDDAESVHIAAPSEIEGYYVIPLSEIFSESGAEVAKGSSNPDDFELDSTTLAEIYCKQGHFSKALSMYKRLMRLSPKNDFLRNKVRETSTLVKEQKEKDTSVDPVMADQMEQVEILDRHLKFYSDVLDKLS
ncbi:tetratricopeptide repeat protein [Oligoflexaceae bacterium]|nr:tetratricopeptide repeat protein [Oligoflexaceae bacterium]